MHRYLLGVLVCFAISCTNGREPDFSNVSTASAPRPGAETLSLQLPSSVEELVAEGMPMGSCGSDSDCNGHGKCSSGQCNACGSDSDCKHGGQCSGGKCGKCGSDSDCKGNGKCSGGKCGSCGSDSDCKVGKCSSGKCGSCGSDSDCKGGRCSSGRCSNAT